MSASKSSSIRRTTSIAAVLSSMCALAACTSYETPEFAKGNVTPLLGGAVSENRTPLDVSYMCYANALRRAQAPKIGVAVGNVADYTGKLSQFEGSAVTQGGSLMVFSALSKLGNTISIHERFDTRVTELELAYSDKQRLGDGQTHMINGQEVPWSPYYGGTIEKSDVYIVGGITELNYNIRSSGAEARIGQTGPKSRTFTLNVAVDLRLVDSQSLRVWSATSVQKQIVGQEIGFEMFRFFSGDDLVDINIGAKAQEPVQFAVRSAIEVATLKLLGDYTGVREDTCVPDVWKMPSEQDLIEAAARFTPRIVDTPFIAHADDVLLGAPPPQPVRDCEDCPDLVALPGGDFVMGSPLTEAGHSGDEGPQKTITLAPFLMSRNEITVAEWEACVDAGACIDETGIRSEDDGNLPIVSVSWTDAQSYADWLSETTGTRYRLPTEAEWEYAARGGQASAYWWGNDFDPARVSTEGARPVDDLIPNDYGLAGMTGNVREWVEDCYTNTLSEIPGDGQPVTQAGCGWKVIRGGSSSEDPSIYRSANRARAKANTRSTKIGFRVVRSGT
ncbi:MAG: SUMF1/EgtB/PvdO family nonheme iron enzyme [Hyphomonas sp.]|nr:SUMF1/EgtB/PvdO family nonheme iron enzyme [Hyphomonas sp.]